MLNDLRWLTAAIWKTGKSLYLSNGSTERQEIWHGDEWRYCSNELCYASPYATVIILPNNTVKVTQ